jgi:hypothetical protein
MPTVFPPGTKTIFRRAAFEAGRYDEDGVSSSCKTCLHWLRLGGRTGLCNVMRPFGSTLARLQTMSHDGCNDHEMRGGAP